MPQGVKGLPSVLPKIEATNIMVSRRGMNPKTLSPKPDPRSKSPPVWVLVIDFSP